MLDRNWPCVGEGEWNRGVLGAHEAIDSTASRCAWTAGDIGAISSQKVTGGCVDVAAA